MHAAAAYKFSTCMHASRQDNYEFNYPNIDNFHTMEVCAEKYLSKPTARCLE